MKRCDLSIQIGLGFFAALALSIYYGADTLYFILAAAVHEMGHIAAIFLAGGTSAEIEFKLSGIYIIRKAPSLSPKSEIFILLLGPTTGIAAAVIMRNTCKDFSMISIMLSMVNLLPIKGTDGGSLLETVYPGSLEGWKGAALMVVSLAIIILPSVFAGGKTKAIMIAATVLLYIKGIFADDRYI